jgi:hypothetical protein
MRINLRIDELVLDGVSIDPADGKMVKSSVELELSRLLSKGGLSEDLASGTSLSSLRAGSMEVSGRSDPSSLGTKIAGAIYRGIGR